MKSIPDIVLHIENKNVKPKNERDARATVNCYSICVYLNTHTLSIFQFAQKNEKTYIERRNYFTSFARGYVCLHIGEH